MAALTIIAGLATLVPTGAGSSLAQGPKAPSAVVNKITLALRITGLGTEGCEVEIKPGHPGCQFQPITRKLDRTGQVNFPALEVKSTSADRDCLFAITVKEPGQSPRTIKRGLRLNTPAVTDKAVPEQTFLCLLRSPSLASRDDATKTIR